MAEKNNAERMRWVREKEKKYAADLSAVIPTQYAGKNREDGNERGYKFSPSTSVMIAAHDYIIVLQGPDSTEGGPTNPVEQVQREGSVRNFKAVTANGKCRMCKGSGRVDGIGVPPNGPGVPPTANQQVLEMFAHARRVMRLAAHKALENRGVPSENVVDAFDTANTFLKELGDAIEEL